MSQQTLRNVPPIVFIQDKGHAALAEVRLFSPVPCGHDAACPCRTAAPGLAAVVPARSALGARAGRHGRGWRSGQVGRPAAPRVGASA